MTTRWMEVVLVMAVACLLPYAHAQLGERMDVSGPLNDDTLVALDSQEGDNTQGSEVSVNDGQPGENEDAAVKDEKGDRVTMQETFSKTVDETYMGCLRDDDYFNGSLNFINLSTVLAAHEELNSEAEACFHVCLIHAPFTWYLTLAPPLNGSVHACGCHYEGELDSENEVNENECEESPPMFSRYKVYCGPGNLECYNGAHTVLVGNRHSVIALLTLLFIVMKFSTFLLLSNH